MQEDVFLMVSGAALRGFQEINITRSKKDAALSFAMKATNPAWQASAWALREGADIEIYAGGDLLLRGQIDVYESDTESGSREVRVNGRSKSAKAVDHPPAKHKTGRVDNKTLLDAAKEFDEFGVGFSSDVSLSAIPKLQRDPRESVWQTLNRYAQQAGVFLEGQPDGSIKITRGGKERHAGAFIDENPPVKKISVKFDQSKKRSPIIDRSQRALGIGKDNLRQEIKTYDETVGAYRPAVIFNEPDVALSEMKKRADWQRLRQNAASTSASVTTYGWRDSAGKLWTPGHLIFCQYPIERLDQDLQIESVTYTLGPEGTISKLTLVDPATSGGKRGKSGSDKAWNPREASASPGNDPNNAE